MVTAAMAQRGLAIGLILHDEHNVRFTAPGLSCAQVTAAMAAMDLDVSVRDDLGSISVISAMVVNRSDITATILSALETSGIHAQLITCTPNRVTCHVLAAHVGRAAQVLHDAFQLHTSNQNTPHSPATQIPPTSLTAVR
jgi:aspartate kinase